MLLTGLRTITSLSRSIPSVSLTSMASLTTHASPLVRTIDVKDEVSLKKYIDAMTAAFQHTALTRAFSAGLSESWGHLDRATIRRYVEKNVRSGIASGATLVESGDMSAVALWELPGHSSASSQNHEVEEDMGPLRETFMHKVILAKQKYIGTVSPSSAQLRSHYHLEFLGRNPDVLKVSGAITSCVRPFLEQAQRDGMVVWLEATTRSVKSLYEHYGFHVVEKILLDEGKRDEEGNLQAGGPGIPAWGMIYDGTYRRQQSL